MNFWKFKKNCGKQVTSKWGLRRDWVSKKLTGRACQGQMLILSRGDLGNPLKRRSWLSQRTAQALFGKGEGGAHND